MKNRRWIIFSVAALLAAGTALAQAGMVGRFDIPFDFAADGIAMPAGGYELSQVGMGALTLVHMATGARTTVVAIGPNGSSDVIKLSFRKLGKDCWIESAYLNGRQALWTEKKHHPIEVAGTSPASTVVLYAKR